MRSRGHPLVLELLSVIKIRNRLLRCHLVSDTQVCNQQGLIGFAEHKEAETQNIASLPPVSQLFENAER